LPSLRQQAAGCPLVLVGTPLQARRGSAKNPPLKDGEGDSTDFRIFGVVKSNLVLDDRPFIELPRYISPVDAKDPPKFLIFCDFFQGRLDPYKGVPVKSVTAGEYLRGALALDAADRPAALLYFVRFLGNEDPVIAGDAYLELIKADYGELRRLAANLSAEALADLLQDPQLAPENRGLCALLLGHCGTDKHAKLLRRLLGVPQMSSEVTDGLDRMLAGYLLLKPKEGLSHLRAVCKSRRQHFLNRYSALRTVHFLWDNRPDVVDKKDLAEVVCLLLEQGDIADVAVDDLRRWGRWEVLDQVLALFDRRSHDSPTVKRAVMLYALSCQHLPAAAAFVKKVRERDAEWVRGTEKVLPRIARPPAVPAAFAR
jgi:hypothetical protein